MVYKVIKSIFKFFIGLGIGLLIFSLIIKNISILSFFETQSYAVHLYAITTYILSGIYAFPIKEIYNIIKKTYYKSRSKI